MAGISACLLCCRVMILRVVLGLRFLGAGFGVLGRGVEAFEGAGEG